MKASLAVLLASLVGAGVIFASAQATHQPTSNDNRAEDEVRRLNAEEVEAFLHNDPRTMARLWSGDLVGMPTSFLSNNQQSLCYVFQMRLSHAR
jgi:hypothetical protein